MIDEELLEIVAYHQKKIFEKKEKLIERELLNEIANYRGKAAIIIKGIRRSGKSTLLKLLKEKKLGNNYAYFNFDDDRIVNFSTEDFQKLMTALNKIYGKVENLLFDEIHNIKGWELFVNRLLREGKNIYITGSNSAMLSKELGKKLTGRHVDFELTCFNFKEFLISKGIDLKKINYYDAEHINKIEIYFDEYFLLGGFPEVVLYGNKELLRHLFSDIIYKDVVERFNVRKPREMKAIAIFLLSNIANRITYRNIAKYFSLKSVSTAKKYVEYAEDSFVVFSIKRYYKKQRLTYKAPFKIYAFDHGFALENSPKLYERKGNVLENIVALHLKSEKKEFYYFLDETSKKECDFVVPSESLAIQVCYNLTKENIERELKGLKKAMNTIGLEKGIIIAKNISFKIKEKKIHILPAWKFLLKQ